MRRAVPAVLLAGIALAGCGSGGDKEGAVAAAREAYAQASDNGTKDLSTGPCLANPLDEPYEDWVVDIVHEPRQASDDEAVNQCSAYRDGTAKHFVELDQYGHLVTAQ
jgi:hypothetical protein